MLDGYPGDASFTRLFGGDNRGFGEELEARGFEVMGDTESNYTFTQATLTSMLHMRPLHEIPELAPIVSGESQAYPLMRETLNDNPAFDLLRGRGYRVVTSSSGYEHVTMRGADEFLDDGSLNEVERHLIRFTTLHRIIDAVAPEALPNQHRQRILAGIDFFGQVCPEQATQPTFAIIHIPVRTRPCCSIARATPAPPPREGEFDGCPSLKKAGPPTASSSRSEPGNAGRPRSGGQPNRRGRGADHRRDVGSRSRATIRGRRGTGSDDHYANYFAVRTPPGTQPALSAETTPVNLLSSLFNTYLADRLSDVARRSLSGRWLRWAERLPLTRAITAAAPGAAIPVRALASRGSPPPAP